MLSWGSGVQQPGVLGITRLHLECSGAFLSPQGQLPEAPAVSPSPEQEPETRNNISNWEKNVSA